MPHHVVVAFKAETLLALFFPEDARCDGFPVGRFICAGLMRNAIVQGMEFVIMSETEQITGGSRNERCVFHKKSRP